MLIKVGDRQFGWGAEVRALPENKEAYGPHVLGRDDQAELAKAIRAAGWEPSWRSKPTERVVFLCSPGNWRQTLASSTERGLVLQVVEVAPATPKEE